MRIHPINESYSAIAIDSSTKILQLKPPLHTIHQHNRRNEHAINEIMEDAAVSQNLGAKQQNKNDPSTHGNNFVDDEDDDFMARIVDGTCRGIFTSAGNNDDDHDRPSLCHLPSCQLGENINVLLHCRQPFSFFSFFHEYQTDEGVEVVKLLPAGAYMMPTECEYCGKSDTKLCCSQTCRRPTYYLQKKRPPFGKRESNKWDPISDHAIPPPPPEPEPAPTVASPARSPGSWVSDLFRRNDVGPNQ